jgi:hypothetical protein
LRHQIKEIKQKIAYIESPRDDSLENANVTPGENSVPAVCTILEDMGLTVKRCADPEEAISRARDLHEEKQFRCIIVGGDERAASCGPSCTSIHAGNCIRCQLPWNQHSGHDCPHGGRGSWLLSSTNKPIKPQEMFQALTDDESAYARLRKQQAAISGGDSGVVPSIRTAVYTAHSLMKEEDRMFFWKLGSTVTDDPKQLVDWVGSLPAWRNGNLNKEGGEENDLQDGDSEAYHREDKELSELKRMSVAKQSTLISEQVKLGQLRNAQEILEEKLAELNQKEEQLRKKAQESAAEHYAQLETSVNDRIEILEQGLKELRSVLEIVLAPHKIGPHNGRDAALSLAWLDVNRDQLLELKKTMRDGAVATDSLSSSTHEFLAVIRKHQQHIVNELACLRQMALGAKVMALVPSPNHKKLLNLCYNWLSTFLPHCLAKVNRVSFGLLSTEDCKAALALDQHVPRSRLKLGVPFIGKDVPSKSSEFAHPDVIIGLTVLAYRYD